jgi:hypothetical protein
MKPGEIEVHVLPTVDTVGRIVLTLSGELHGTIHLGSVESLQMAKQVLWAAGYVVSAAAPAAPAAPVAPVPAPVPAPIPASVPAPAPDENC